MNSSTTTTGVLWSQGLGVLWSQGLVSRHVCPPLVLSCSFLIGLVKLLNAFIHAQRFTGSSPNCGWKWPNKSKAKEVARDTLADLVFECCAWQRKLKEPTVEVIVVQEQAAAAPNLTVGMLGNTNDEPPPCFS
jgi:hypothetical protein